MCFFAGTASKIINENLISVSLDELVSFLSESEVPIPTYLLIPPGIGNESAITEVREAFWSAINIAKQSRHHAQDKIPPPETPSRQTAEHADAYFLEEETAAEIAKLNNALLIVITEPMFLSMYKTPNHYGADIVVAEGQPFGVSLAYGGPYAGLFACKKQYLRQLPGRIVGETVDTDNEKGYVLTLQTREQHIKRDRATSNICTSVGLIALMATVYMALQGKVGLKYLSELCYHKAHYAADKLSKLNGFEVVNNNFFKEFTLKCPTSVKDINSYLHENKVIGGYDLSSESDNHMLLSFTEMNSKDEIDNFINLLAKIN